MMQGRHDMRARRSQYYVVMPSDVSLLHMPQGPSSSLILAPDARDILRHDITTLLAISKPRSAGQHGGA